jgi:nucleoid-associated protein YgaU
MSMRRVVLTGAAMVLVAVVLAALTPPVAEMSGALTTPQRTVDTRGVDSLAVAATGLLAWAVWAWGALGLGLTAASALPGLLGSVAGLASHAVLPTGARRTAALVLGIGLGVTPIAGVALTVAAPPAMASPAGTVPDWPAAPSPAPAPPVPDWPADAVAPVPDGAHVVVRGNCLWHIAADRLQEQAGSRPSDGEIAEAVHAWWTANSDVIGPDPDRLLPGQVLLPPGRG